MRSRQLATRFWWVIAVLSWLGFLIFAMGVHFHASWITHIDYLGQQPAVSIRQPSWTTFFKWFAYLGTPTTNMMICLLVALALWLSRRHFEAGWVLTAQVGINALMAIFKMIMQRPRPAGKLVAQAGYSFPSGHTTSTATMVLVILLIVVPLCRFASVRFLLSLISLLWLGMMGFDRIYLFVHYPSDVLAGLCLSLGWWSVLRLSFSHALSQQQKGSNY